ncbi:apoptosis-inducing factor 1, mitochondrial-like isoform X2 [Dreissena polymorpha]|uniref:apoptosis-inducing factor 1, mitochondrial-like isoform X2 n=1 Tax=Dreissena polymorpha TaxID=45954 RepID=UPI0022645C9B|nr:apoptosis-inducing factor 1, mitochondrial-like isoform X2 [Dreissena polymorpha]
MWSKHACKLTSSFRLTNRGLVRKSFGCCSLHQQVPVAQQEKSSGSYQESYQTGSSRRLTVLVGATGATLGAYWIWRKKSLDVFADSEETGSSSSEQSDKHVDVAIEEIIGGNAENTGKPDMKASPETTGRSQTNNVDSKETGSSSSEQSDKHVDVAIEEIIGGNAENTGKLDMKASPETTGRSQTNNEAPPIDWSRVPDLPSHVPYILIGGGVASLEAYKAIKTRDVKAKVLMISEEDYPPYWRPPLSKNFWFEEDEQMYRQFEYTSVTGRKRSVFLSAGLYMEPKKLAYTENGGLGYLQKTKVTKLDAVNKKVTLENGAEISFDKCLIATGGRPRNIEILDRAGQDVKDRTTLFRNLRDLWRLMEVSEKAKSIAVIGGGFLGSELAAGLAYRGFKNKVTVHQIFPEKGNMAKVLPDYLSAYTTEQLKQDGVNVIPNANVKSAFFADGQVKLQLSNTQTLKVDHIVVAVGLEPNTDLARSANLELDDKHGGFRVNSELQARSDIYVAGDCACFYDERLGRRRVEHHDHAEVTGRMAGFNMAGDSQSYRHQSMFWCSLGSSIEYEAVGLVDSSLQTYSVFRKKSDEEIKEDKSNTEKPKDKGSNNDRNSKVDNYEHGVIFYLKDGQIVGVVLWNLNSFRGNPSRMDIARQVIMDGAQGKDLTEVAKLFNVYAD